MASALWRVLGVGDPSKIHFLPDIKAENARRDERLRAEEAEAAKRPARPSFNPPMDPLSGLVSLLTPDFYDKNAENVNKLTQAVHDLGGVLPGTSLPGTRTRDAHGQTGSRTPGSDALVDALTGAGTSKGSRRPPSKTGGGRPSKASEENAREIRKILKEDEGVQASSFGIPDEYKGDTAQWAQDLMKRSIDSARVLAEGFGAAEKHIDSLTPQQFKEMVFAEATQRLGRPLKPSEKGALLGEIRFTNVGRTRDKYTNKSDLDILRARGDATAGKTDRASAIQRVLARRTGRPKTEFGDLIEANKNLLQPLNEKAVVEPKDSWVGADGKIRYGGKALDVEAFDQLVADRKAQHETFEKNYLARQRQIKAEREEALSEGRLAEARRLESDAEELSAFRKRVRKPWVEDSSLTPEKLLERDTKALGHRPKVRKNASDNRFDQEGKTRRDLNTMNEEDVRNTLMLALKESKGTAGFISQDPNVQQDLSLSEYIAIKYKDRGVWKRKQGSDEFEDNSPAARQRRIREEEKAFTEFRRLKLAKHEPIATHLSWEDYSVRDLGGARSAYKRGQREDREADAAEQAAIKAEVGRPFLSGKAGQGDVAALKKKKAELERKANYLSSQVTESVAPPELSRVLSQLRVVKLMLTEANKNQE